MTDGAIERLSRLTGPEIQVVNLVAVGMENWRIAKTLKISIYSVKKRIEIACEKLNIEGDHVRILLTHYAIHEGLPNLFEPKTKVKL